MQTTRQTKQNTALMQTTNTAHMQHHKKIKQAKNTNIYKNNKKLNHQKTKKQKNKTILLTKLHVSKTPLKNNA